eukprot:TRINITY_DN18138_c0_g1_i7.p1 TRINITY_DN18138_c0_g1~~TRINITY_DN18138_c0_g1_i7.p1  ORF type:complete len:256 (+),score=35.43 TRINITY_DN18138_c0_g1_i7:93-860(+)
MCIRDRQIHGSSVQIPATKPLGLGLHEEPSWHLDTVAELVPGFLSPQEVDRLHHAAKQFRTEHQRESRAAVLRGGWGDAQEVLRERKMHHKLYLQQDGFFERELPGMFQKIRELAERVDTQHSWSLAQRELNLRCAEFHTYTAGGHLQNPRHYDAGSNITVILMLTPSQRFKGGELVMWDSNEQPSKLQPSLGDAVVFVSHKRHSVLPVLSGERCVLVVELWEGPHCNAGHRCTGTGDVCSDAPSSIRQHLHKSF